jgi:hypothetical protein
MAMDHARKRGRKGVVIFAYRDGKWCDLKIYPADVPLTTE